MSIERPYCFDDYIARLRSFSSKVRAAPKPISITTTRHLVNTLNLQLINVLFAALREGVVDEKIIASIDAREIVEHLEPHAANDEEILGMLQHARDRIGRMQKNRPRR